MNQTISLSKTAAYTTSDGSTFAARADALAHEKYLTRFARLTALAEETGNEVLADVEVREAIARNAEKVLEALTVKLAGGRRPAAQ